MAHRLLRLLLLVCSLPLSVSCAPQASRTADPHPSAAPGLALQAEGKGRGAALGPLRVVHHAPKGETDGQVEIAIAFDRPMVELSTQRSVEGLLKIEPHVALNVRWLGSQTLLARPYSPLPMATDYRVTLSQAIRALDGQALEGTFTYTFATPLPQVVSSSPHDGEAHELPSRAIDLYFNQRVSPQQVKAHATLSVRDKAGAASAWAFEVSAPDPADHKRVRLKPARELPRGARVTLRIGAGLRGEEGPRPMVEPYQLAFDVFGPLRLVSNDACVDNGGVCSPHGGGLRFTNPVNVMALRKALRFEPPLRHPLVVSDEDYTSEYVYLSTDLNPGTKYKIQIVGDIKDVFGNTLEGGRTIKLETGPYDPFLYFPLDGEVVPLGSAATTLPLRARNVPKVSFGLIALRPGEVEPVVSGRTWLPKRLLTNTVLPGAGAQESKVLQIDTTAALPSGKGVLLAYATQRPGHKNATSARTVLAYTNLAPTLKTWPRGGLVWVTQLSDTQPVAKARVTIVDCGKTLAKGQTDATGSFRFSRTSEDEECETFAIVEKDGDLNYARKYGGHGPWDLTSNTSYGGGGEVEGYLFTERGLYRPGERMRTKGVLQARTPKGFVPAKGKVKVRVTDSQGREVDLQEVSLSAFGTFSHETRIPGSVPLGTVSISATLGSETFDAAAEVAEYRRAELEAKVEPERAQYVRGETAQVQVNAQYLFGAPVSNQRVIWSARRTEHALKPEGESYEGFSFGDETRWYEELVPSEETSLSGGEGKLDARGDLTLRVPLSFGLEAGSTGVEVEATVEGLGGVTTSARTVLGVTPAAFMLGIRASSSLVEAGKPFQAEVVAAKLSGGAVLGAVTNVSLTRRSYRQELTKGEAGEAVTTQKHTDEPVAGCALKSVKGPARCALSATSPGLHFLRVRGQDDKGRKVTAAIPIYVYGVGQASWGEEDSKVLALKADKTTYKLGEVAQVLVPSPFGEAEAFITVERDGVLSVERKHLAGGAPTLSIPIDERFVPNGFVSVLLMRGARPATNGDDGRPDYRIGTVELRSDVSRRHLRVAITPDAADKAPGEEVRVDLQVKDGAGANVMAELTVFAVDEGVLSLSGYKTPDPFARLYAPQGLSVWTSDVRGRLVKEVEGEGDDKGGSEGGGGGATLRRDFESVAFYAPEVLTDEKGKAQIKFKLPDSLTRYRIMAVAVSRTAELGSGEASVRTHKPLMVRPMLPRVIRVGDTLEAGATLQTESDKPIEVEVTADVQGLEVEGQTKRTLRVSKDKGAELRFKLRATSAGNARLRFTARSGKHHDAFEVNRAVLAPNVMETVSTTGATDGRMVEALGVLKDARHDVGGLALSVSTSALNTLETPVRALIDYPYGCTEQLSSRLIGVAALTRLAKLGVLEQGDARAQGEQLTIAIERRQRSDGSFALWDDDRGTRYPPLDAFLTGYALFSLQQAERAGFAPSKQAGADAKGFLSAYLRGRSGKTSELLDADRVFVMYALALAGAADKSYAGTFLERRQKLPLISQVELAHTLLLAKDEAQALLVIEELINRLRVTADEAHLTENLGDGYQTIMVSDVRATSELVLLLSALDADHALLPRLARWLSNARVSQGDWGSTQENAWGLMALSGYLEQTESKPPAFTALASIDGEKVLSERLTGRKAHAQTFVAMRDLPQAGSRIDLSRKGQGRMHYTLRLSYAKQQLPQTPLEQGFFVEREYERVDPVELAQGRRQGQAAVGAKMGDYVRVTLRVAVPATRRFVVIEDPLPAGLEPMSFGLATESQAAASALGMEMGPVDHTEIRDDKIVLAVNQLEPGLYKYTYLARAMTPGRFVAPPARAEEMYHRETFGRTRAAEFEVLAR